MRKERQVEHFAGGIGVDSGYATIVRINSGNSSATFSLTGIYSGRPVVLTPMVVNASSPSFIGSGQNVAIGVNSVVNNVSAMVVTGGTVALTAPIDVAVVCLR